MKPPACDPRAIRARGPLQDALAKLAAEKSIPSTTIEEVTGAVSLAVDRTRHLARLLESSSLLKRGLR